MKPSTPSLQTQTLNTHQPPFTREKITDLYSGDTVKLHPYFLRWNSPNAHQFSLVKRSKYTPIVSVQTVKLHLRFSDETVTCAAGTGGF